MDRTLIAVHNMLEAIHAPSYDIGVLSDRGMLPGLARLSAANVLSRLQLLKAHNAKGAHIYIRPSGEHRYTILDDLHVDSLERLDADGYEPCAVVETSPGNFQAWLKHDDVYAANLSTLVARTLAKLYRADPSAADWRRFGRLPGFTNCKPKYLKSDGLYPFVLLKSWNREQHSMAGRLRLEITKLYQLEEQERRSRIAREHEISYPRSHSARYSRLSLEQFRSCPRYHDRPAAADIAFCVAAYSLGMPEAAIAYTLEVQYLSGDPNPSRRSAYIRRTMAKARSWAQR